MAIESGPMLVTHQTLFCRLGQLTMLVCLSVAAVASSPIPQDALRHYLASSPARYDAAAREHGRMIILPGIGNTSFHLAGFVRDAQVLLPNFEIEVRPWGVPLLGLHNLRAYERNRNTADEIARDIASWRRAHSTSKLYLVGYSGGGGVATLVTSALSDDVAVDRLILVAPAVSPTFPIVDAVLPHVNELVVNYASQKDLQVGAGTRLFGTIDRASTQSAGATGFAIDHARLVEWRWSGIDQGLGHAGNHVAYLGRRWQRANLLPALDPRNDADAIRAHWGAVRMSLAQ